MRIVYDPDSGYTFEKPTAFTVDGPNPGDDVVIRVEFANKSVWYLISGRTSDDWPGLTHCAVAPDARGDIGVRAIIADVETTNEALASLLNGPDRGGVVKISTIPVTDALRMIAFGRASW